MKFFIKFILILFILFILLFSVFLTTLLFSKNYDEFINWILISLHKEENWASLLKSRFTENSFFLCKKIILGFDILVTGFILFFTLKFRIIENAVTGAINYFKITILNKIGAFNHLPRFEKYLLISIILFSFLKALYYSATIPIQYDEAWSYNYFVGNKFWQSFLLPGNNHKLFTFLAWIFNLLPFDKTFLIRLPNAIGGVWLLFIFYNFLKKYFQFGIALIGIAWLATCVPAAVYMGTARSYLLVILFSALLTNISFEILNSSINKYQYLQLFLIIFLGYFSCPVFFYCHFILSIYLLIRLLQSSEYQKIKNLIFANLASLPFIILIYLPDLLGGHFNSLMGVAFNSTENKHYFFTDLTLDAPFQLGLKNTVWIYIAMLLFSFVYLFFLKNKKQKRLLLYSFISIVWLIPAAEIQHAFIACRVAIYITLSVTLIIMFLYNFLFGKYLNNKYFITGSVFLIICYNSVILDSHPYLKWSFEEDKASKIISNILIKNKAKTCFIYPQYFKPNIEFYHKINNSPIKLFLKDAESVDYSGNDNLAAYILVNNDNINFTPPPGSSLIFKNNIVSLFKNKEQ